MSLQMSEDGAELTAARGGEEVNGGFADGIGG
jgi:hypothetical protein